MSSQHLQSTRPIALFFFFIAELIWAAIHVMGENMYDSQMKC